jgi:hypothetical protein
MKIILFSLLVLSLSVQNYTQDDVINLIRGSGRHTFTPITGSYVDSYDILRLEGNYTRAKNINGATSCKHFMVFKYTGGVYDSLETITWNVEDPIADTPGTYYSSGLYKMKNNSWVYAKGDEETFQTELKPPIIASIQSSNLCLNLTFGKNAEAGSDSMVLQRDTISGSTWTDVSWLDVNEHTYKDTGGLFYNGGYKYRLANYRHNRYYSSISTAKVINPNPPLTLSDDPFVVVMDSTGTVVGASYSRALVSIDFEDGDTSDIGTVTSAGTGTALSSGTGYKYIGDRGAKMILGTTDPNIYEVKTAEAGALTLDFKNHVGGALVSEAAYESVRITRVQYPPGLKLPVSQLFQHLISKDQLKGVQSESLGDYAVTYLDDLPKTLTSKFQKYKRLSW